MSKHEPSHNLELNFAKECFPKAFSLDIYKSEIIPKKLGKQAPVCVCLAVSEKH